MLAVSSERGDSPTMLACEGRNAVTICSVTRVMKFKEASGRAGMQWSSLEGLLGKGQDDWTLSNARLRRGSDPWGSLVP